MSDTLRILLPIVAANVVVLVIILLFIRRLLLGDTMRAVERIRQVEADIRKKEENIRRDMEDHDREFRQKKAEAEEEMQRRRQESEKEIGQIREQVVAQARQEGERIVAQAHRNEEKLRQQIAQDMEEKAVEHAGAVFELVFSEKMTRELDGAFTNELLEALAEMDASTLTLDSTDVSVLAAHPLEPEPKARLERLLAKKFKVETRINEEIQADLMAGLVFRLGSLEIDGSLRNRFREAVAEVKKEARG